MNSGRSWSKGQSWFGNFSRRSATSAGMESGKSRRLTTPSEMTRLLSSSVLLRSVTQCFVKGNFSSEVGWQVTPNCPRITSKRCGILRRPCIYIPRVRQSKQPQVRRVPPRTFQHLFLVQVYLEKPRHQSQLHHQSLRQDKNPCTNTLASISLRRKPRRRQRMQVNVQTTD